MPTLFSLSIRAPLVRAEDVLRSDSKETARTVAFLLWKMEAIESLPRAGVIKRSTQRESAGSGF